MREWCRPWNYTIPTATTWRGGLGSIYGATTSVRICDAEVRNQNKGFSDTDEVRLVGNAARQMAGRAATAAPAAGSNIPEGLSSPAALAQRQ